MIAEVRRQVKNGVDFIKLADSAFGEYQSFREEELVVIADLAHQLGKRCTIHARGDAEVAAAARAGFDWIMHGNIMTQGTVDLLAEKEIPLVPTLLLLENWAVYGPATGAPKPIVDGCRRMLERTHDSLHMARAAGVKFVLGTDSGFAITPYGEWHATELELLMKYAGVSELEAIRAATYDAGVVLNLEGEIGRVAPGMLADLLVVDGDPSEDITVLQDRERIEQIILDGEVVEIDREHPVVAEPALLRVLEHVPDAGGGQGRTGRRAPRRHPPQRRAHARARPHDPRPRPPDRGVMTVDIRTALKQVIDPELGIDIVDLGMVRGIEQEGDKATVAIVLTTMSCPFWDLFVDQIQTAVIGVVDGVKEVAVKYDGRVPWTPDLLADEARWELEIQGMLPTSTWLEAETRANAGA